MTHADPKKKTHNALKPEISPQRRRLFRLILLAFPFLLIVAAELILRWSNYGGDLHLVVKRTLNGKEYYALNRSIGRKYFDQEGIQIPEAIEDDLFDIVKSSDTKRIFMLGESTMAGFPYDYNATAPRLLQDRLRHLLPEYKIEVVNAGLSAINSYTVLDFIKELNDYQPDLYIIYLGHNEYYGASGIGSTQFAGASRWLITLSNTLMRFRLYRLLHDGFAGIRHLFHTSEISRQSSLMENVSGEKVIPYHSDEYLKGREIFRDNLEAILSVAEEQHVPVVFSTLVSNLHDQAPFIPTFLSQTPDSAKKEWNEAIARGRAWMKLGRADEASREFFRAVGFDSLQAEGHFELARCLDTLGRHDDALSEFRKARDYDGLRFRATTEFNDIIRSTASTYGARIADVESAFGSASPHGIIGKNLVLEHLHPNFDGYFLMAKTFFRTIIDDHLLVPDDAWQWKNDVSDSVYRELSGVTDFTLETGGIRIFQLVHAWPFVSSETRERFVPSNRIQELALSYLEKKIPWSSAHYRCGEWFAGKNDFVKARAEYYAVTKVLWYWYYPYLLTGDMDNLLHHREDAERMYKLALGAKESPYVYVHLGNLYLGEGRTEEAIHSFIEASKCEDRVQEFLDKNQRSLLRTYLGAAYRKSGRIDLARENYEIALQLDPNNVDARHMRDSLK